MMCAYLSRYHKSELLKLEKKAINSADMDARFALEMALQEYDEAVINTSSPVKKQKVIRSSNTSSAEINNSTNLIPMKSSRAYDKSSIEIATNKAPTNLIPKRSSSTVDKFSSEIESNKAQYPIRSRKNSAVYNPNHAMFFQNKSVMSTPTSTRALSPALGRGRRMISNESLLNSSPSINISNQRAQFDQPVHNRRQRHSSMFYSQGSEPTEDSFTKEDKERRLQKLLAKADQIIAHLSKQIKPLGEIIHSSTVQSGDSSSGSSCSKLQPLNIKNCLLRDYQLTGLQWLLGLHSSGLNGILADEMGLGKTVQVLSFLMSLYEQYLNTGPHLIIMPLSVITSWKSDIEKFIPAGIMDIHVHLGNRDEREEGFNSWRMRVREGSLQEKRKIFLCLTSYNFAISDSNIFRRMKSSKSNSVCWDYVIVDEGHRLKNSDSKLFNALLMLESRHHLLLTGTPLQNNLKELWSLLHFVLPRTFADFEEFSSWFNHPFDNLEKKTSQLKSKNKKNDNKDDKGNSASVSDNSDKDSDEDEKLTDEEKNVLVQAMHRVLKPFILRRVKSEVAKDLPNKVERIVYCPMSSLQVCLHDGIASQCVSARSSNVGGRKAHLKNGGETSLNSRIINMNYNNLVMQLRKLCNHPYLVLEDVRTIPDSLYFRDLVCSSGKLVVLDQVLDKLLVDQKLEQHKILIFSQMTTMLNILQGFLYLKGISCYRLDGSTDRNTREDIIRDFQGNINSASHTVDGESIAMQSNFDDENVRVFLLSTRAGGVGVNLQSADTVIIYDSDWNPQQDLQAISRAHRIGQNKDVLILRLVSVYAEDGINDSNTYTVEQRMLHRAKIKLQAEKTILAKGKFDMKSNASAAELNSNENLFDIMIDDMCNTTGPSDDSTSTCIDGMLCDDLVDFSKINHDVINCTLDKTCHRGKDSAPSTTVPVLEYNLMPNLMTEEFKIGMVSHGSGRTTDWAPWLQEETEDGVNDLLLADNTLNNCTTEEHIESGDIESFQNIGGGYRKSVRQRQQSKPQECLNEEMLWKNAMEQEAKLQKENRSSKPKKEKGKKQVNTEGKINKKTKKTHDDTGYGKAASSLSGDGESTDSYDECAICHKSDLDSCDGFSDGGTPMDPSVLLICDGCEISFHPTCIGLKSIPHGDWYCKACCSTLGLSLQSGKTSTEAISCSDSDDSSECNDNCDSWNCPFCSKHCLYLDELQIHLMTECHEWKEKQKSGLSTADIELLPKCMSQFLQQ